MTCYGSMGTKTTTRMRVFLAISRHKSKSIDRKQEQLITKFEKRLTEMHRVVKSLLGWKVTGEATFGVPLRPLRMTKLTDKNQRGRSLRRQNRCLTKLTSVQESESHAKYLLFPGHETLRIYSLALCQLANFFTRISFIFV